MIINNTKNIFKTAINSILQAEGTDDVLSEAALPAYAHKNPIIDYIFWKRLDVVVKSVLSNFSKDKKILDFGCGTGVLSYQFSQSNYSVTAIDLDLSPKKRLSKLINFPENIDFIEGNILEIKFPEKFDVIIALDVLEHIPLNELPVYLELFSNLLCKNGQILISGPTENILYKIGRFLAGSDFTGAYHETNIAAIRNEFVKRFDVKTVKKIFFPFTLFEIFSAMKK